MKRNIEMRAIALHFANHVAAPRQQAGCARSAMPPCRKTPRNLSAIYGMRRAAGRKMRR
jgi:hypothetical protein